ncbi:MAG: SMP-30/gluconolactonase/LRE family protein [Planctomycetaceae bacterium]|nr:SMP-30/gluconolactonase/LRE family protein [Planctomycetales bacterium]MCB9940896.1 SMP-30/gluconolactonase/LRE family protein [Planctomycetaceae bacterium]
MLNRTVLFVLLLLPVMTQGQDMPLSDVLIEGEAWELVGEGFKFTEGPAVDAVGNVFFTDVPSDKIYKVGLDGAVTTFVDESHRTSGMIFGPNGKLYGCRRGLKQIVTYDERGNATVIAENVDGNDLVVNREGGVYFTEPSTQQIWYISPSTEKRVVDHGIEKLNGIILWPDQRTLVVADTAGENLWAFRIEDDGSLRYKQPYYTMRLTRGQEGSGADGLTVDTMGRLYVATHAGLQFFDTQGRISGVIANPNDKRISNVTFGGEKLDTLFITCGNRVFRRKTQATGIRFFDAE